MPRRNQGDHSPSHSSLLPSPVSRRLPRARHASYTDTLVALFSNVRDFFSQRLSPPHPGPLPRSTTRRETPSDDAAHENDDQSVDEVEEVVVDRSWAEEPKASSSYADGEDGVIEDSGSNAGGEIPLLRGVESSATCGLKTVWNPIVQFFNLRFVDDQTEAHYQEEVWAQSKRLSLWASCFFILNWVFAVAFIQKPVVLADKLFYYAIAPVLTFPLLLMCACDTPSKHSNSYQLFLCVSIWSWSIFQVLFAALCGFYREESSLFSCSSKDFVRTFYYTAALQTIALFGACLKRLPALIGAVVFLVVSSSLIFPIRISWARNMTDFVLYQAVLLYMHYQREHSDRKLYTSRVQLNIQVQHTHKAQMNERRAAESKRRLTSYVRVPLNTALLAVQNMEASLAIPNNQEVEFNALGGSLSMMSKVLNDVLDFNRLDSGRFELLSKPYAFHQAVRSMLLPLRLATDARGQELVVKLDMRIDDAARHAQLSCTEKDRGAVQQLLETKPSGETVRGMVVGDETRLRQIITNLASNACKFTPPGGQITITTKLILPEVAAPSDAIVDKDSHEVVHSLSVVHLNEHNLEFDREEPLNRIVVRVEVADTGWGIRRKDIAHDKLFSAFNQTEQGRQQGGKGTGLGLALVRKIVERSGGRLGVRSKVGVGSTFWVELPLGVGSNVVNAMTSSTTEIPLRTPRNIGTPFNDAARESSESKPSLDPGKTLDSRRSSSALQSVMDQQGSVELTLPRYNSQTIVTTCSPNHAPAARSQPDVTAKDQANGTRAPAVSKPLRDTRPSLTVALSENFATQRRHTTAVPPTQGSLHGARLNRVFHVLVVDDDPLTRTLMKRMLTRLGCTVTTAENGEIGLNFLLGFSPKTTYTKSRPTSEQIPLGSRFAVVFMDNQMPVMSGQEAVAQLRKTGRHDFVVGITGNALLDDQKEYLEAGADHVLTKPVLERSLKSVLLLAEEREKHTAVGMG